MTSAVGVSCLFSFLLLFFSHYPSVQKNTNSLEGAELMLAHKSNYLS